MVIENRNEEQRLSVRAEGRDQLVCLHSVLYESCAVDDYNYELLTLQLFEIDWSSYEELSGQRAHIVTGRLAITALDELEQIRDSSPPHIFNEIAGFILGNISETENEQGFAQAA